MQEHKPRIWAKMLMYFPAVAVIALPIYFIHLEKELRFFKRNALMYKRFVEASFETPESARGALPRQLKNLPLGEKTGVVLGSKSVEIRGVDSPYNASILKKDSGGYQLFFRYDFYDENALGGLTANLGCVDLDTNFDQTNQSFISLNTRSAFAEDPRAFSIGEKTFVVYNDLVKGRYTESRVMHLAEFNQKKQQLQDIQMLDLQQQPIEKNWVPFEYKDKKGDPQLYFEYTLAPLKLVKWSEKKKTVFTSSVSPYSRDLESILWPQLWGTLRGGTPAQKVDGQYLAFFHSSFKDSNEVTWYCMGAYMFEDQPPFRITGISSYPILFEDMYSTPPANTACPMKRVIFPAGFVVEERDGKEVIQLSCGENDAGIKIVTLDKEQLLKSMKKVRRKKMGV